MTLCWLLGHVWAATFTPPPAASYHERVQSLTGLAPRRICARFCVCCGAHVLGVDP